MSSQVIDGSTATVADNVLVYLAFKTILFALVNAALYKLRVCLA